MDEILTLEILQLESYKFDTTARTCKVMVYRTVHHDLPGALTTLRGLTLSSRAARCHL
jgi:hypothetical protein